MASIPTRSCARCVTWRLKAAPSASAARACSALLRSRLPTVLQAIQRRHRRRPGSEIFRQVGSRACVTLRRRGAGRALRPKAPDGACTLNRRARRTRCASSHWAGAVLNGSLGAGALLMMRLVTLALLEGAGWAAPALIAALRHPGAIGACAGFVERLRRGRAGANAGGPNPSKLWAEARCVGCAPPADASLRLGRCRSS